MNLSTLLKIALFLLYLLPTYNWSQTITGNVVDLENNPLRFVSVAIINQKDSILISYANTDKSGAFELTEVSTGEHILQAHLIGFKTYQKMINFKNKPIELGVIILENDNELDEVVVTLVTPISIKKDTVTYNTKAFNIRIDDTVEDLLKKLPGIEVDVSGRIKAQGEEVTKIYVDGKDFFSGDPVIATKNLSADIVKRVDVIDEKSEKARVTGINDHERKKVINLEIIDDKRVNDFGKLRVGYGTDERYLTGFNYNRFSPKLQASVIGSYNNVNSSGSDISELMNSEGNISSSGLLGFLTNGIGGLNLGYELKNNKNFNGDYFYSYNKSTSGDVNSTKVEFIEDKEILSESKSSDENISNNHNINFAYTDRSNKLSSLQIDGSVIINSNKGYGTSLLDKYNGQSDLDLQSVGETDNEGENNSGNVTFQYTRRINKKSKRNFSVLGDIDILESNNFSNNDQVNRFNIADPDDTYGVREKIKRDQELQNINAEIKLDYIEPITKNQFLKIKGNIKYVSSDEYVNQSRYENDIIQNPLIYDLYYKNTGLTGGIFYKYDKEKFTINIGGVFAAHTQDFGLENEEAYNNRYTNFNPKMTVRYRPNLGKYLVFILKRSIKVPSLFNLTPVVNDFNSLYIRKGNPQLTPEKIYSISGTYLNHNFSTGFNFFSHFSYKYINNSIVNSEFTNELGVQISTYKNSGNKNSINGSIELGKSIKSIGLRYSISLNGNYSEYLSVINNINNETQSKNNSFGISLDNIRKEKIDVIIGATWYKNYTTFSSGNTADREYFQQSYFAAFDWNVTDKLNLNSKFKYDIYTDSNFRTDQSVPVWNASISYNLLKSKSLGVKLSAIDILNKNTGIIRNSTDNYFEEVHQEVLGNYYMLSLIYNLKVNR